MKREERLLHTAMVKENTLKVIKTKIAERFTGEFMLSTMDMEVIDLSTMLADEFVFQLNVKIFGQENIQEYEVGVKVPKNWWEHLRKSIGLSFKTVMETRTIRFNHTALMPNINRPKENEIIMYSYTNDSDITIKN